MKIDNVECVGIYGRRCLKKWRLKDLNDQRPLPFPITKKSGAPFTNVYNKYKLINADEALVTCVE